MNNKETIAVIIPAYNEAKVLAYTLRSLLRLASAKNIYVDIRFTSKLVDGRFPEYSRVIPAKPGMIITAGREELRQALQRAAILSNEKYRGIRFSVKANTLTIQAHNPEQEEAEEQLEVVYDGAELDIGFNVNYLLDALGVIDGQEVEIGLTDGNSSCLIKSAVEAGCRYVVMPMRL